MLRGPSLGDEAGRIRALITGDARSFRQIVVVDMKFNALFLLDCLPAPTFTSISFPRRSSTLSSIAPTWLSSRHPRLTPRIRPLLLGKAAHVLLRFDDALMLLDISMMQQHISSHLVPCSRRAPLTKEQWEAHIDDQGIIQGERELRELIFHGGVAPEIRRDVWKFLLGHRRSELNALSSAQLMCLRSSSHASQEEFAAVRSKAYADLKMQLSLMSARQLQRNSRMREEFTRFQLDPFNIIANQHQDCKGCSAHGLQSAVFRSRRRQSHEAAERYLALLQYLQHGSRFAMIPL